MNYKFNKKLLLTVLLATLIVLPSTISYAAPGESNNGIETGKSLDDESIKEVDVKEQAAEVGGDYIIVGGTNGDYNYNYNRYTREDNKYHSEKLEEAYGDLGIRDIDLVESVLGSTVLKDNMSLTEEGIVEAVKSGATVQIQLQYTSTPEGKMAHEIFGSHPEGLQNFITKKDIRSTQQLSSELSGLYDKVQQLNTQINSVYSQLGQTAPTLKPGETTATLVQGVLQIITSPNFAGRNNSGDAKALEDLTSIIGGDLMNEIRSMTGLDFNQLKDLKEAIFTYGLTKSNTQDTLHQILKPAKLNYRFLEKVVFSLRYADGSPVSATLNVAETEKLFAQYNSALANEFKKKTGMTMPPLKSLGGGKYELDFGSSIKSKGYWATIDWSNNGYNYNPALVLNLDGSRTGNLQNMYLKIETYGNRYTYSEKIALTSTYANNGLAKVDSSGQYDGKTFYSSSLNNPDYHGYGYPGSGLRPLSFGSNINNLYKTVTFNDKYTHPTRHIYCYLYGIHGVNHVDTTQERYSENGGYALPYSSKDGNYVRDINVWTHQIKYFPHSQEPILETDFNGLESAIKERARVWGITEPFYKVKSDSKNTGFVYTNNVRKEIAPDSILGPQLTSVKEFEFGPKVTKIVVPTKQNGGDAGSLIDSVDNNIDIR